LSYSTFEYALKNVPSTIKAGENIKVTAEVKNTGKLDGDEVVELYVSLTDSKLKTAIRSLQGFKRIHLKAGEVKEVEFELKPIQMSARNNDNFAVVEAGPVQISVGGKQPDAKSIASRQVVQQNILVTGNTYYIQE